MRNNGEITARRIGILGGTGFVGRHLIGELARHPLQIRVLTRHRERHRQLLVFPRLELVETDIHYVSNLGNQLQGCDAVINLVGILNQRARPGEDFRTVHAELPEKLAEACRFNRIPRLLHMSALQADPDGPSEYLRSKGLGENALHGAAGNGLHVTSFRPSVIFGPDDQFFNRFARLLAGSPFIFPLACPQAKFAPVYVLDVARAFARALDDKNTYGGRFDLCGPRAYTLEELVRFTAQVAERKRLVFGLGSGLSGLQAHLGEFLPGKPFSRDNLASLQVDSTCIKNGFTSLGIVPQSVEAVVPRFLGAAVSGRPQDQLRKNAGRG